MSLSSPHTDALAANIVEEHFGKTVQTTCTCLLDRGVSSLGEIIRITGLTPSQVRESLLILMQHNCVSAYGQRAPVQGPGQQDKVRHLYEARATSIVQRLRMAHILAYIRELYKEPASDSKKEEGRAGGADENVPPPSTAEVMAAILTVLLQHGRLRPSQAVQGAAAQLRVDEAAYSAQLHAAFAELVRERCLERCRPCDMPRVAQMPHRASMQRRGAAQRQRQEAISSAPAVAARAADEAFALRRFSLADPPGERPADADPPAAKRRRLDLALGDDEDDVDAEPAARGAHARHDDRLLWRVNQEELSCRLRDATCVAYIRERHDEAAATVVAALLARPPGPEPPPLQSVTRESGGTELLTQAITEAQLLAACRAPGGAAPGAAINQQRLTATMQSRALTSPRAGGVVAQVGTMASGRSYCVNLTALLGTLRQRQLDAALRDKFGESGARVFKLLAGQGQQLEQRAISERAMLPIKTARELLYRMLKARYVSLQDVPRSTDHAPSKTFYTFRANTEDAFKVMQHDIVHALLNLRLRHKHERDKQEDLLQMLRRKEVQHELYQQEDARAQVQKLQKNETLIASQVLRLTESLQLFASY